MKAKLFSLLTALLLAAAGYTQGGAGDTLTWYIGSPTAADVTATLTPDSTLTVSGSGKMMSIWSDAPWHSKRENISTVVVGSGVTSVGSFAFSDLPNLTSVVLGDDVAAISSGAFASNSELRTVTLGSGLTEVGGDAFRGCTSLTSLTLPESLATLHRAALNGCTALAAIHVAEGNSSYASVDGVLFFKDKHTLVLYPKGRAGAYAIPEGVGTVGNNAFNGCTGLTSLTIPKGLWSIDASAFADCSALEEVINFNPNPVRISDGVFENINISAVKLKVPEEAVERYRAAAVWQDFDVEAIVRYTVRLDLNGGWGYITLITDLLPDSTITAPVAPIRTGHTFSGWYKDAACTNAWNFATDVVTENTTLYAKWTAHTFKVLFKVEGVAVDSIEHVAYGSRIAEPADPVVEEGYVFHGWFDYSRRTYWSFDFQVVTENLELEAAILITRHQVCFYRQDGRRPPCDWLSYGDTITAPAAPIRKGYIFGGWYTEEACVNEWNFATNTVTRDITLYAKWTAEVTAVSAAELLPLTLYPTVTNGQLTIDNEQWVAEEAVEVYSMSGALVAKVPTTGKQTTVNLSQLPNGTYVVRVGRYVGKVVKL